MSKHLRLVADRSKARPTLTQSEQRRRKQRRRDQMRAWLEERIEAAKVEREKAKPVTEFRGVDRVPSRLREVPKREPRMLHEHIDLAGWDRRHKRSPSGAVLNRWTALPSRNKPYVGEKDRRLAGKARRRARREANRGSQAAR